MPLRSISASMRILLWASALLAPFAFIVLLDVVLPQPPVDARWRHDTAAWVASAASTPDALPATGWTTVKLPFRQPRPATMPSSAWYRVTFSGVPSDELWAVYFARPYSNVAAYVNGTLIGDGGPFEAPVPLHRSPLLFEFPARLLRAGDNVLHVRSSDWDAGGRLDVAMIGPRTALEPAYRFTRMTAVTIKHITVIMMLAMSAVMAALYSLRRRDSAYGWFAAGLVLWAAHIEIMLVPRSPFPIPVLWDGFQGVAVVWYVICAALFVHRFLGMRRLAIERVFLLFGAITTTVLFVDIIFFGYSMRWFFPRVMIPGTQLIGIWMLWQLVHAFRTRADIDVRLIAAASWLTVVVGIRDGFVDTGLLPGMLYLTYTVGVVLFVFGTILLRRFVRALDTAERANEQLEQRVREKTGELEQNLIRLKDLERERALSAERERIMQDMHDGVGGHLVQALSIATSRRELEPVAEPIRTCLDELRLMIDSIEPVDGDLASVLGTLRMRMSRRLAEAGINVHWDVADLPPLPDFGPKRVLEITRIVQEAITNALKHARARQIRVSARACETADGAGIQVEVSDDGSGFRSPRNTHSGTGRGVAGMQRRAADLGGRLIVESSPAGTRVRLELPLHASNRAARGEQDPEQGQSRGDADAHSAAQ